MVWDECFPEICKSLFRIKAQCSSGTFKGSGFLVAKYKKTGKNSLVFATAKHLIKDLPNYENIHWTLEKFDLRGNVIETLTFKTNIEKMGESAIRVHDEYDIALLFTCAINDGHNEPLRIIDPRVAIIPGAKVGWAGFPAFAEKKTIRTNPCYFEGVISTTVDYEGKLFYMVDGHGGEGLSGGPLWYWNSELSNYEIIGICSGYVSPEDKLYYPGLVSFESINPLISYLKTSNDLYMNIIYADEKDTKIKKISRN